jgi:glycosyltransferase involved in cell wall biosynthesis
LLNTPRLAVVVSHPTQYYSPWFRWISENTGVALRVFYLWDFGVTPTLDLQFQKAFKWDVDLLTGYEHEFVRNSSSDPGTHHFGGLRNPLITNRLAAWQPDAILLFGYKSSSQLRTIFWAKTHGVPLLFRGDSHFIGRRRPPLHLRIILRFLYAQFHAITFVGAANRNYFESLGVQNHRLFFAPHAVDSSLFDVDRAETRTAAAILREKLGISQSTRVVLFAGKLVPAKQPAELLAAFIAVNQPDTALVFVGDGQEKAVLIESAKHAAPGSVHFLPFANQSEMPSRYAMADVFVLPSRGLYETWGLAVNEAMHSGVPALVSDRVGCQQDLVTDGITGWVFRADDIAHLQDRLKAAVTMDLTAIRANVRHRISRYTYADATMGLVSALRAVLSRPSDASS